MIQLVEDRHEDLARLCREYRVRRLDVFGSVVKGGDFKTDTSDLDFLVEFLPLKPGQYADTYFGLLEALQELFGQKVDLVMTRAVTNPYFLESINENRVLLYAA